MLWLPPALCLPSWSSLPQSWALFPSRPAASTRRLSCWTGTVLGQGQIAGSLLSHRGWRFLTIACLTSGLERGVLVLGQLFWVVGLLLLGPSFLLGRPAEPVLDTLGVNLIDEVVMVPQESVAPGGLLFPGDGAEAARAGSVSSELRLGRVL